MPDIGYFPVIDGVLVKNPDGDGRVFFIRNGQKCYVPSGDVFQMVGLDANDIEMVSGDWLNAVPDGPNENGAQGQVPLSAEASALNWHTPYLFRFDHSYFRGSQHIQTFLRVYTDGQARGEYVYHNDSEQGFCGGIVIGICNGANQLIQYFTPPSGCIGGKPPGNEITRGVAWGDQVTNIGQTQLLRISAYETWGEGVSVGQIGDAAQKLGVAIAQAVAAGDA